MKDQHELLTAGIDETAPESVDPSTAVWRYMTLGRFVSLIEDAALWFTRIDCLDDQWEGVMSEAALVRYATDELTIEKLRPIVEKLRVITFVNCWTMRDQESAGLWDTYVPQREGVVVRSTVGRLESATAAHSEGGHVARVRYIDYAEHPAMDAFNKRRGFESEQEVRAAFYDFQPYVDLMRGTDRQELPTGRLVNVDVSDLILEVRVAPASSQWFLSAVERLARRYGLDVSVVPSELDVAPPR